MMRLVELVKEILIGLGEWLCFVLVLHGLMLLKEEGNALSKLCLNRPHFAALELAAVVYRIYKIFQDLHVNPVQSCKSCLTTPPQQEEHSRKNLKNVSKPSL